MKKYISIIVIALLSFTSCEDYLSDVPSKQNDIVPTSVEYLEGLLVNKEHRGINTRPFVVFTDDYYPVKEYQYFKNDFYSGSHSQFLFTWNMNEFKDIEFTYHPWKDLYQKIYIANTILQYLPDVSGTDTEKQTLKGDAYYLRALSNFLLVNLYSPAYNPDGSNVDANGIPLQKSPSISNFPERSSIEETYNFIFSDLEKAEEMLTNVGMSKNDKGYNKQWRASLPGVFALYAKVYLVRSDYANAQKYAKKAIDNSGVAELIDYNTEVEYAGDAVNKIYTIRTSPTETAIADVLYPMIYDRNYVSYSWKENFYHFSNSNRLEPLVPSTELTEKYGNNEEDRAYDLRWKYMFVENYSYKDNYFKGFLDGEGGFVAPKPFTSYVGYANIVPNLPEMYLIDAECEVRKGNFSNAQTIINNFRSYRIDASAPTEIINLTFKNAEDALVKVLEEKRREFPFYSRWFEMRRLIANGEYDLLPSSVSRDFFEYETNEVFDDKEKSYTLNIREDVKKFVLPIPFKDIKVAKQYGVEIEQNQY